jgi:quinol monooxygenase YgiN
MVTAGLTAIARPKHEALALAEQLSKTEETMAIGIIATLKIQDGKEAEFEAVFADLSKAVRANEKGNKFYQLCRSRTDKGTYIVMEMYEDDTALKAHGSSEHFRTIGARMGPTLAGRPDVQYFDAV